MAKIEDATVPDAIARRIGGLGEHLSRSTNEEMK